MILPSMRCSMTCAAQPLVRDDVRCPAAGAGNDKQRGKHRGGNGQHVIYHGRKPIDIGKNALLLPHHGLDSTGDVEQYPVVSRDTQLLGDGADDLVARIGDGIQRVTETDDDFLVLEAAVDVLLGVLGVVITALDLESDLVCTAVQTATQRADGTADRRIQVGTGAGSAPVPVIVRAAKVEALNSCSA